MNAPWFRTEWQLLFGVDAVCTFLLPLMAAIRFVLSCFTLPIYLSVYYLTSFHYHGSNPQ
jgi:hypothetical protein